MMDVLSRGMLLPAATFAGNISFNSHVCEFVIFIYIYIYINLET